MTAKRAQGAKEAAAKAPRRAAARKSAHIDVRMYNVGFGDCFLLRIPTAEGERRVLVDCGFHSQGKGKFKDRELVAQIKEDLAGEGLDVVIATHRHQDHISGFGEKDLWKEIAVAEVWLPCTMRPGASKEEPALAAWEGLLRGVSSLVDENGALTAGATSALGARSAEERSDVAFMLWNARANTPGIENLMEGMKRSDKKKSHRRFLPESGSEFPQTFTSDALPGVTVHVLGPPRDPNFRKAKAVPRGWGIVEDATAPGGVRARTAPFGMEWQVPKNTLPSRRPFIDRSLKTIRGFNDDLMAAAAKVEGFLNGESLVLVLEFGGARLLLPGDAEVGAWMKILESPEATALAESATFLKVGHHGSHNATPLLFLKELAEKTPAMMSTQEGSGNFRNHIPRKEILDTMKGLKMPLARSDKPKGVDKSLFTPDPEDRWIDGKIPC